MHKPEGHNAVSPYLIVAEAGKALAFIDAVFGAKPFFTTRGAQGGLHVEVRIDDTVVMLGEAPDGPGAHLHVYVLDVDAHFARAKAAGGIVLQEVAEQGDGDRRGGITDPAGTTWWLSSVADGGASRRRSGG